MKYISKVNQRYLLVLRAITNKGATWKQLHEQVKPCAKPQATMDLARHMALQGYLEAVRRRQESGQTAMCYFVTPLGEMLLDHFRHSELDAGHQKAWRAKVIAASAQRIQRRPDVWPGVRYIYEQPKNYGAFL